MPRYIYECACQKKEFIIDHLSDEIITFCPYCDSKDSINKKLANFQTRTRRTTDAKRKVGSVTEAFIKDSREELKQQKDDLGRKD